MPVYGKLILGEDAYAEEARIEAVTGNSVYGALIDLGDRPPAPAPPPTPQAADLTYADAVARMNALLGESYSVADAEQGLLAHPDIWTDLALAELARAATAGVRKGVAKALLATGDGDAATRAMLDTYL